MIDWTTITKEEFKNYEQVRASGITNMFAVNVVSEYSGLANVTILTIMSHYKDLMVKYPGVRDETSSYEKKEEK